MVTALVETLLLWLLVALPGMLFAALPAVVILAFLVLFYVAEWIVLGALRLAARRRAGGPVKEINTPKFPWTV